VSPIIGLIATYPRFDALSAISIPSIASQTRLPDAVVIVTDRHHLPTAECQALTSMLPDTEVHFLPNNRASGAAGTWNTGLHFINQRWPTAYVAILDDDDSWDSDHLAVCKKTAASNNWPDVVISGLRISSDGQEIPRPLPYSVSTEDFLIGNPGWQGSNTFAKVSRLMEAGGFREGLTSCHDRDLAIRILDLAGVRISFTRHFTATWHLNACSGSLSQPGPQKRQALRLFLELHGYRMSPEVRKRFMARCFELFQITPEELQ